MLSHGIIASFIHFASALVDILHKVRSPMIDQRTDQRQAALSLTQLSTSSAGARSVLSTVLARWAALTLSQQFAVVGATIILLGMSAIGSWTAKKIEQSVTNHSAAAAALYMDAFITPLVQELANGNEIGPENKKRLDAIMQLREISENVRSVKIWQKGGLIAYSNFESIIGQRFTPTSYLKEAWSGTVSAHISDLGHDDDHHERLLGEDLIEIYAPIRESNSHRIIAVSEFYMRAAPLKESVQKALLQSWALVGIVGTAMMLGLYGVVRRGTNTIEHQKLTLIARSEQNSELRQRIEDAYWRADQRNEQLLNRLGADLHDGPAQFLGFALMRLDDLPLVKSRMEKDSSDGTLEGIRSALEDAIKDIRQLSRGLILPQLDAMTVNDTVAAVVRLHEERTGSAVSVELPLKAIEASKEVKVCVYRFVQEGLTNSFKHANGNGQAIEVAVVGSRLRVRVSDKGPGIGRVRASDSSSQQLGLNGIRDRVETLAGKFEMYSPQEGGTVLQIALDLSRTPLQRKDHAYG